MFIQQIFLITTAPLTRYCCNKLGGFLSSLSPQSSNSRELKETDYEPREYCLYLSTSSLWSHSLLWVCQLPGSASPFKYNCGYHLHYVQSETKSWVQSSTVQYPVFFRAGMHFYLGYKHLTAKPRLQTNWFSYLPKIWTRRKKNRGAKNTVCWSLNQHKVENTI